MKTAMTTILALLGVVGVAAHGAGIDAEYVSVSTRTLADGNTIRHETVGRFAQDDKGRTRFEFDGRVDIVDPVAGVRWTADTRSGQAFRSEMPRQRNDMDEDGIAVTRVGDPEHVPDLPDIPRLERPDVTEFGPAVVNGVETTHTLYRNTIQAGALGNTEPIVVETEVWRSDSQGLSGLPVKTEVRDPINGRSVQQLRNIRTLTPDEAAELFRPDNGWTVVEAPLQIEAISAPAGI